MNKTNLIVSVLAIFSSMVGAEAFDKTMCPEGFVLVKKTNTDKQYCFFESHAKIIEFRGWGTIIASNLEPKSGLIFTMITMPPDKIDYIHDNWKEDDMVTSERIQVLNLFPEKTRAIVITTETKLNQAILLSKQTGIEYVVYNNESNNGPSSTPPDEIENTPEIIRVIADRVHDEGLKFVSAPSYQLMIKTVNDVNWEAVNPEIVAFQLQRSPSTTQLVDEFNEKAGIIRPQSPESLFMLQINPEWQTIDDVKYVLANTNGDVDGISIVCNFDSCTEQYLDEILGMR